MLPIGRRYIRIGRVQIGGGRLFEKIVFAVAQIIGLLLKQIDIVFGGVHLTLFVFHVERVLEYAKAPKVSGRIGVLQCEANIIFRHRTINVKGAFVIDNVSDVVPAKSERKTRDTHLS